MTKPQIPEESRWRGMTAPQALVRYFATDESLRRPEQRGDSDWRRRGATNEDRQVLRVDFALLLRDLTTEEEAACRARYGSGRIMRGGKRVALLDFKGVGDAMGITRRQAQRLLESARSKVDFALRARDLAEDGADGRPLAR